MKSETGIFITPTPEQMGKIWAACALENFPASSDGVLQLLMLAVEPEEDEEPEQEIPSAVDALEDFMRAHPEQVAKVKQMGAQMLNGLLQRFKKPGA